VRSSDRIDALRQQPRVKVGGHEPDLAAPDFQEGDAPLKDEAAKEPFRAPDVSGVTNVNWRAVVLRRNSQGASLQAPLRCWCTGLVKADAARFD